MLLFSMGLGGLGHVCLGSSVHASATFLGNKSKKDASTIEIVHIYHEIDTGIIRGLE